MLEIKNLSVEINKKKILKNIDISFEKWKTYFLLWRNWSGKSSLALTLMWHPKYIIESGEISIDWVGITSKNTDEISKKWIFLSFQNIPEIPGIKLFEFLRTIYNEHKKSVETNFKDVSIFLFKRKILPYLFELNIPESFLDRDLNVSFSWWEKRKIELLQIKLLEPKYIILDEIDSWLDIDAFKIVANELNNIKNKSQNTTESEWAQDPITMIFITHNFKLLEYVNVDCVYILDDWEVIQKGWIDLIKKVEKEWFCAYCKLDKDCKKEFKCE